MKNLITLLLIFTFSCTLFGQQLNKANRLSEYFEYSETISVLNKIIEKDYKGKDVAIVKLADSYRLMNLPDSSYKWYSKAVELDSVEPMTYYYYGQSLRSLGKYDEAKQQFLIYDSLTDDQRGMKYAQYCDDIKPYLDGNYYEVSNIGALNSEKSDFTPVKFKNGVVLSSDRNIRKNDRTYDWTGNSYLTLFYSKLDSTDNYEDLLIFSKHINNDYHDATPTFNSSGDVIYFTRTVKRNVEKDSDNMKTNKLMIFYSYYDYENEKWSKPTPISLNNESYSIGHPFLLDDNTMYFVSDMEGGFGGTDIYVSYLEEDVWSDPKNLGEEINTFGNEMFPSVEDDLLYFSSDGHLGYGGLDIFVSSKENGVWGISENLRQPLNSSYDDFGASSGMFSSNRTGGLGGDDIYSFVPITITICGKVIDMHGLPIVGATIFAYSLGNGTVDILKTGFDGEYCKVVDQNVNYVLKASKSGYFNDCMNFKLHTKSMTETIEVSDLILIKFEMQMEYVVRDIYYDFDKWNIREDSKSSLDFIVDIMNDYDITIELGSHTDARGSDEYNMMLSQKRAESAVEYIVSKGIDESRITAKGYGETVMVNDCVDGVACTREQHQENRRTEFKVITVPVDPPISIGDSYNGGDTINVVDFEDGFLDCEK